MAVCKGVQIAVLGASGSGKTALIKKFTMGEFCAECGPTKCECSDKKVPGKCDKSTFHIHEVGGGPGLDAEKDSTIKQADGFIIVYDMTMPETFEAVKGYQMHIHKMKEGVANLPIYIVATKSDLKDNRGVSMEQGANLSKEISCTYFEASAMSGENVEQIFNSLAEKLKCEDKGADSAMEKADMKGKKKCCVII